ncbi:hypothetical protein L2E82_39537 [Cichorium intybus]|uniref:Uncharacterized protein n=1 Tax=Cichorium intybus TaxID=13427 RepID=A0ACB9AJ40_CICIN|nr:hypothetical protein L2E82_39537 [Cichorium intybus]
MKNTMVDSLLLNEEITGMNSLDFGGFSFTTLYLVAQQFIEHLACAKLFLHVKPSAGVFVGTHDGEMGAGVLWSLEERVNHSLTSGDVLLIIRHRRQLVAVQWWLVVEVEVSNDVEDGGGYRTCDIGEEGSEVIRKRK